MNLNVEVPEAARDGILRFAITGERSTSPEFAGALQAAWQRIAAASFADDTCRRVLVVIQLSGERAAPMNMYSVASAVAKLFFGSGRKVAVVLEASDEVYDTYRFGEDVAVNRGIDGRLFRDESSAVQWLKE